MVYLPLQYEALGSSCSGNSAQMILNASAASESSGLYCGAIFDSLGWLQGTWAAGKPATLGEQRTPAPSPQ